jgi:hypothetical protein
VKGPSHNLKEFEQDCSEDKVVVMPKAANTARKDFNLKTAGKVVQFIGRGGLEKPRLINSKPWENNPEPIYPIMVDAYSFYSGFIFGYLAFFYNPKIKKWVIKSFKKNSDLDPRNLALAEGLRKISTAHH